MATTLNLAQIWKRFKEEFPDADVELSSGHNKWLRSTDLTVSLDFGDLQPVTHTHHIPLKLFRHYEAIAPYIAETMDIMVHELKEATGRK